MKIGVIAGKLPILRQAEPMENRKYLLVRLGQEEIAAADFADAGVGDLVLVLTGPCAAKLCMGQPLDAAVIAVLEPEGRQI